MTTSSPTVSVVIPTHNRVDMTARALRSVLTQTYSDFEVIVVDDASTDETADSVRQLTDPRVSLLRHETNRGAAAARNTGLASARGAYVAFLDSDDEWLPKKLELQVERFAQNLYGFTKLGAVVGRYLRGGSLRVRSRSPFRGNVYPRLFKHWGGYFLSTMLCRKVCLEQVGGFDENVPALQWWDLCVRIAEHWEFDDVELPLSIQHDHAGPRIRTADRVAEAHTVFLEKYKDPSLPHFREFQGHLRWALGMHHLAQGEVKAAATELGRGLRLRPSPGVMVRGSLVMARDLLRRR